MAKSIKGSGGTYLRETMSYVHDLVTGSRTRKALEKEECRRYAVTVSMRAQLGYGPKHEQRSIIHEIRYRDEVDATKSDADRIDFSKWRQYVLESEKLIDGGYVTPDTIRHELEGYRPRNAFQADWSTFNFDSIVYILGAMLATTTVAPMVGTKNFRKTGEKVAIAGLVKECDIRAIATDAVFIPHTAGYFSSGRAFPALVHAVHLSGSKVVTDFLPLDRDGCPEVIELSGGLLSESCCEALGVLAYVYYAANKGDVYALALTKGIHTVMTVVGHSDEGGFMRDVLRRGVYSLPRGGIPAQTTPWSGFGLVTARDQAGIEEWVDQIAIVTAATVAHCDPMLTVNGKCIPTIFDLPTTNAAGSPATDEDYFQGAKSEIRRVWANFSRNYTHALAKCLGFPDRSDESNNTASGQLEVMLEYLTESRHLKYPVVAPFFWTEPTGILPRNAFGTDAEKHGSGSLVGPRDSHTIPYLAGAVPYGRSDDTYSQYAVPFTSLRGLGCVLFCHGSPLDGMGQLYITQAEPQSLSLTRKTPAAITKALNENDLGISLAELAWVRGQSKIPHPAEVLHLDEALLMTIVHAKGEFTNKSYFMNIPNSSHVLESTVELFCSSPQRISNAEALKETADVKRDRTRATKAITTVLNLVHGATRSSAYFQCSRTGTFHMDMAIGSGHYRAGKTAPEVVCGIVKTRDENPAHEKMHVAQEEVGVDKGTAPVESVVDESKGVGLQPARVHDSLRAPQPFRDVSVLTATAPPPPKSDGQVAAMPAQQVAGAVPIAGASPGGC